VAGTRFWLEQDAKPATVADVLQGWQTDAAFRTFFNHLLAEVPFSAFRWETPPLTHATLTSPFEFVVLDSPSLARPPEPDAFAAHFNSSSHASVVEFSNLGRDAILIVPCPNGPSSAYGHLAAFVRQAPAFQQQALWQLVGEAVARRVSVKPVWLSTAGAGVAWLHVRLDDHPKYYGFAPYRQVACIQ
jgi:hypothetical protein